VASARALGPAIGGGDGVVLTAHRRVDLQLAIELLGEAVRARRRCASCCE
jgi:hypothetical protein